MALRHAEILEQGREGLRIIYYVNQSGNELAPSDVRRTGVFLGCSPPGPDELDTYLRILRIMYKTVGDRFIIQPVAQLQVYIKDVKLYTALPNDEFHGVVV